MRASNLGAMGLIGMLVFLAGVHLLWQARAEVLFWIDEFLRIFRGEFARRGGVDSRSHAAANAAMAPGQRYRGTLRMIAALALMLLGPLLFLIDLTS